MKQVLFIQPSLSTVGGIEKVVPTVALEFAHRLVDVSTYVFYGQVPEEQNFWKNKYCEEEENTRGWIHKIFKVYGRMRHIRQILEHSGTSVVIVSAQGAIVIMILMRLLRIVKVPVIAYIHEARGDGGWLYRFVTWLVYPLADGLICVSRGILEEIMSIPFVKKQKVILAYNALPIRTSSNLDANLEMINTAIHPIFITAGRLEFNKGADLLVDIFINYFKTHAGTLFVLGTGSLKNDLESKVDFSGLSERIKFLGQVSDTRGFMSKADLYVSAARSEPFGLALIEALSVGLPVVATDVPSGPREILSPNLIPNKYPFRAQYGILTRLPLVGMYEEYFSALDLALMNPFAETTLVGRANFFTVEKQVDQIMALINKLITK